MKDIAFKERRMSKYRDRVAIRQLGNHWRVIQWQTNEGNKNVGWLVKMKLVYRLAFAWTTKKIASRIRWAKWWKERYETKSINKKNKTRNIIRVALPLSSTRVPPCRFFLRFFNPRSTEARLVYSTVFLSFFRSAMYFALSANAKKNTMCKEKTVEGLKTTELFLPRFKHASFLRLVTRYPYTRRH